MTIVLKNKILLCLNIIRGSSRIKNSIFFILVLSILCLGVFLRFSNQNNVGLRSPDEQIYTVQANVVEEKGTKGISFLIEQHKKNKQLWIYPPPTRVGYLWILAVVMKFTNNQGIEVGAKISFFFSVWSLLLLIVIGLKFFNRFITLYALIFMSVSPLAIAISRRTWQDAILGFIGFLLIYFCCEIIRNSGKIIWYVLFVVVGSFAFLIKESGVVIYGLCIIWLLWVLLKEKKYFLKGIFLLICSILGISISVWYLIFVSGGFSSLIETFMKIKEAMPTNIYAIQYQSEPWYQFLGGFFIMSPLSAFLSFIGIRNILLSKKNGEELFIKNKSKEIFSGILFFMITFIVITSLTPYCQNLRYLSVLFGPFYLISGLGLWGIITYAKIKLNKFCFNLTIIFILIVCVLGAISDYKRYNKIFVKKRILDTSNRLMRDTLIQ